MAGKLFISFLKKFFAQIIHLINIDIFKTFIICFMCLKFRPYYPLRLNNQTPHKDKV